MATRSSTSPEHARTPLAGVLALTFLGSIGTGSVTNGVSFIAESAYGYGARSNALLMLTLGGTYTLGAITTAPALRAAVARFAWLTTRRALGLLLGIIAGCCVLPAAIGWLTGGNPPQWAIWLMVVVFSPATGALWPIVESYLSGGRRGRNLRNAVGRFNITWSIAVFAAMWVMAPLVESAPLLALVVVGLMHIAALGLLAWFPSEPARHDPHAWEHEPHPESHLPLLRTFRIGLPASYILLSTLVPLLPSTLGRLGVEISWKPPIAGVWMLARVASFLLLERWHGWHGRASMPAIGGALLIAGFASTVLAGLLEPASGLTVLVIGLVLFGLGMATIYVGALSYALECGRAEVAAGGMHEALIGLGYTLGPAAVLLAGVLADRVGSSFDWTLVWVTIGVVAVVCLFGWWRTKTRHDPPDHNPHPPTPV